jgi:Flp pilus assembly protein TadD
MLTHIDANGNDSPAIIVDNTTAANRGVNIPEFVNMPQDGIAKINPEETEYYRLFNQAYDLLATNRTAEAIPLLEEAVERDANEPIGHYALATALSLSDREHEAAEEYGKACALNPNPPAAWYDRLALSEARTDDLEGAIANFRKSLAVDPTDAGAEDSLGTVLCETGQTQEGFQHMRKAIVMAPDFADAHNHLGWELAKTGQTDEAIVELQKAIELRPASVEYQVNLGYVMAQRRDFAPAAVIFERAVKLSGGKDWRCLDMLAGIYDVLGRTDEAVETERQALNLAIEQNNQALEKHLESNLEHYERARGKLP